MAWIGQTISVGKGLTMVGTVAASDGFEKLTADRIQGARILAGVPEGASVTTTPAMAGFKTVKAATMNDSVVAGRDRVDGTKATAPSISVKAALNSLFYHTDTNGTITKTAIQP